MSNQNEFGYTWNGQRWLPPAAPAADPLPSSQGLFWNGQRWHRRQQQATKPPTETP